MKILGIDYGRKRIGLALSDESLTLARELGIVSPKVFWRQIRQLVADHEIKKIILGLPLNMQGKNSAMTLEIAEFKHMLEEKIPISVEFMDERLSTAMTRGLPGGQSNKDSLAAQIILQNYLNKQSELR